jgi:outer membrane protein OmpA-like peptidoglycan-associated protein
MVRLLSLLLFIAVLAFVAIAVRNCSSNQAKPGVAVASPSGSSEIVALRDRTTLLVQKDSVGEDIVDWVVGRETAARKFELGGHQFVGRTAEPTPEALGRATRLVAILRANPDVSVTVIGHTDPSPDAAADRALSLERAQGFVQLLTNGGIRPKRLEAEGHGSSEPVADNRTAEGRASNQRVSLVLRRGDSGSAFK